jgi:hypothetical protein
MSDGGYDHLSVPHQGTLRSTNLTSAPCPLSEAVPASFLTAVTLALCPH